MSRRTILSLAASVIIGIGFIGTVSTEPPHIIAEVSTVACLSRRRLPWWLLPWCTPWSGGRRRCCCGRCCRGRCRCRGCLLRARLLCATASSLRILSLPCVLLEQNLASQRFAGIGFIAYRRKSKSALMAA